jgi:hypothetical protein
LQLAAAKSGWVVLLENSYFQGLVEIASFLIRFLLENKPEELV